MPASSTSRSTRTWRSWPGLSGLRFGSAGASYRGLLPARDRDTAPFALYYGGFSRYLRGQTYELVLEWTYAIALGRRLTVQPDVQYVINPGGVSSVGNAVVLGVQVAIEF
jgi:porin